MRASETRDRGIGDEIIQGLENAVAFVRGESDRCRVTTWDGGQKVMLERETARQWVQRKVARVRKRGDQDRA